MGVVELLKVEDSFAIKGRGLILCPDFLMPKDWQDCTATLAVVKPDGEAFETTAQMQRMHFNIADPKAPRERRWRVVVFVPNMSKADIPPGCSILVSPTVRYALELGDT